MGDRLLVHGNGGYCSDAFFVRDASLGHLSRSATVIFRSRKKFSDLKYELKCVYRAEVCMMYF